MQPCRAAECPVVDGGFHNIHTEHYPWWYFRVLDERWDGLLTGISPSRICSCKAWTSHKTLLGSNESESHFSSAKCKGGKCQIKDGYIKVYFCIWENTETLKHKNTEEGKWAEWGHRKARNKIAKRTQGCTNSGLNFVFCYNYFSYLLFSLLFEVGINCKLQIIGFSNQVSPC